MYHNISFPTAIFTWALLTSMGVLLNIKFSRDADKTGKICHRFFRRRGELLYGAVIAFFAVCGALRSAVGEQVTVAGVVMAVLILVTFAVWLPMLFGYYVTQKGIIYAGKRSDEKFTAREYNGKIGIFGLADIRNPICTVEDSTENRELLAEFWRELPARKENPYRDKILQILDKWEITFEDFNIDFSLPFKCQTVHLGEDLLQAKLGNYIADIGWHPEFDPKGKFRTVLIEKFDWERPVAEYEDRNFDSLEKHLREIAKRIEDFYS